MSITVFGHVHIVTLFFKSVNKSVTILSIMVLVNISDPLAKKALWFFQ
jgi:hypothetical protein